MDNIRIRAIEGERKGKGYAKDGERRRGEGGGDRTREQERAPWKRTCKMVYEERPRRRRARGSAQLQLPFSSACAREGDHGRARGPMLAFSFSSSLSRSIPFFLSISLGLSFPAGSYARVLARTPPVQWRAPTLINAKLRRRAYFRAGTRDGNARFRFSSRPFFIDAELIYDINLQMAKIG